MLHSPDNSSLWVESAMISAIMHGTKHQDHVARETHAIVYAAGHPFGVRETYVDVIALIKGCGTR